MEADRIMPSQKPSPSLLKKAKQLPPGEAPGGTVLAPRRSARSSLQSPPLPARSHPPFCPDTMEISWRYHDIISSVSLGVDALT